MCVYYSVLPCFRRFCTKRLHFIRGSGVHRLWEISDETHLYHWILFGKIQQTTEMYPKDFELNFEVEFFQE